MNPLNNRAALLFAVIGLVVLSLRPSGLVDRVLTRASAPLRYVAQISWPIRLASPTPVVAEDRGVRDALLEEAASRSALEALHRGALTAQDELAGGRRQVPAAVVSRDEREPDRIYIRPWTFDGLEVGQPVVQRGAYVGRVVRIDTAEERVEVDLVTANDFLVGARVEGDGRGFEPVRLVVGGLAVERRASGEPKTWLMAHNPSRRPAVGGAVVVDELLSELDRFGYLAEGYALGVLESGKSDGDWRVRPVLDFLHGLYQVVVLTPERPGEGELVPPLHPLSESTWARARPLTPGDPSPWRQSVQIDAGRADGVESGAAVVCGARLIGRVGTVREWSSSVLFITDPGFSVPVVGRPILDVDAAPSMLGRFVGLGDEGDGLPVFHWRDVTLPEAESDSDGQALEPMRLFTGSGEDGLPAGLLIGEAELPIHSSEGRGHRIELSEPPRPLGPREWVWVHVGARATGSEVGR